MLQARAMKLRYWSLALAPAWLTYWGLSHLVHPFWAVIAAVWVCTVAAFVNVVLFETRGAANATSRRAAADDTAEAERSSPPGH